eukprot:UN19094
MRSMCSKPLFISRNQPHAYYFDYVILRNFSAITREKESKYLVGAPKKFFSRVRNGVEGTGYLRKWSPFAGRSQQEKKSMCIMLNL